MSAAKYTAGPWELRGEFMTRYIYARGQNISGVVATVNLAWPGQAQRDEQLANALLMVAAPDMLEELVTVVFHLRRDDFKNHDSLREQAIDSIEKTIAKAKGEVS